MVKVKIPLTQGFTAIVSESSVPLIAAFKWHASVKNGVARAQGNYFDKARGRNVSVLMHRLIVGAMPGEVVDHINGDALDNTIENLRIATAQENSRNHAARGKSGFNGVRANRNKWVAGISPVGLEIGLGTYDSAEIAAAAYNAAAKQIYGRFARLNDVCDVDGLLSQIIETKRAAIARLQREIEILSAEA